MDATTIAKEIRSTLKARGISNRKVSVTAEHFGISDGVNVRIKDPAVDVETVKAIACGYERVRRCEITGDILGGGNTYISVTDANGYCR